MTVTVTDLDGVTDEVELGVHLDPSANAPFAVDASFADDHETVTSPYNPSVQLRLSEPGQVT